MSFQEAMNGIATAFTNGDVQGALTKARALKRRLLSGVEAPDPNEVGWARYYEVKALHALEEWQQLHQLMSSDEPEAWLVTAKNSAWMNSVAAEAALKIGQIEEIPEWGQKSLEARQEAGDPVEVLGCLKTVCALLHQADRPDLNQPFAQRMLELGEEAGAEKVILVALDFLCDHAERVDSQEVGSFLKQRLAWLAKQEGSQALLKRIRSIGSPGEASSATMVTGGISANGKRRIYRILCNLAGSDGVIGEIEAALLQKVVTFFGLPADEAAKIEAEGRAGQGLRVGKSPEEREYLLRALIEVAAANGKLTRRQEKRLSAVGKLIGMPQAELHQRLKARFTPPRT